MNDSFMVKRCTHKSLQLGFFFLFFLKKNYLKCHALSFKHSIHLFPNLNIHKIRIRRVLMVVVLVLKLEATIHYLLMFFKIGFRKNFAIFSNIHKKTPVLESLFNIIACPATLLKQDSNTGDNMLFCTHPHIHTPALFMHNIYII